MLLTLTASVVVAPMLFTGVPAGHDYTFHLNSWSEAASQLREGIFYPRWAAGDHFGFGEPRFILYPPASWMLGAALGSVVPWTIAPGAFIWLAVMLAGASMFLFAREYLAPREAALAALLYAANPYFIAVIYRRAAYAELLADAIAPLVFLYALRLGRRKTSAVVPLAVSFAAVWLSNVPAALVVTYSLALVFVFLLAVRKDVQALLLGAAAMALGLLLAAFYIVPAAFEHKWINFPGPLQPFLDPANNFLFLPGDIRARQFNFVISAIAVVEIVAAGYAILRSKHERKTQPEFWRSLTLLAAVSAFLMFPVSVLAWRFLPKLDFVQFPWRWLSVLNVALAMLVPLAARRVNRLRLVWLCSYCAVLAAFVVFAGRHSQIEKRRRQVAEIQSAFDGDAGYEGALEYLPRGAQPDLLAPGTPKIHLAAENPPSDKSATPANDGERAAIHFTIQQWGAELKTFTVNAPRPSLLSLRLLNYPAWTVRINGQPVSASSAPDTAQLQVQVPAGRSNVEIKFGRTEDRTLGAALSLFAAAICLGLALVRRAGGTRLDKAAG
jgi:hypothetical protein